MEQRPEAVPHSLRSETRNRGHAGARSGVGVSAKQGWTQSMGLNCAATRSQMSERNMALNLPGICIDGNPRRLVTGVNEHCVTRHENHGLAFSGES